MRGYICKNGVHFEDAINYPVPGDVLVYGNREREVIGIRTFDVVYVQSNPYMSCAASKVQTCHIRSWQDWARYATIKTFIHTLKAPTLP